MSIFTDRELEFLASLRRSWGRLYRIELARLLKEDAEPRDRFGIHEIHVAAGGVSA